MASGAARHGRHDDNSDARAPHEVGTAPVQCVCTPAMALLVVLILTLIDLGLSSNPLSQAMVLTAIPTAIYGRLGVFAGVHCLRIPYG